MIFVTVGTHEQQFDRLIQEIDKLVKEKKVKNEVFMQIGYSTYIPQYCKYKKMLNYDEMSDYIEKASVVITHGGPASFLMPIKNGKVPIVVPRQAKYGEHVNDHQVDFVKFLAKEGWGILPVYTTDDLYKTILLAEKKQFDDGIVMINENNLNFCKKLDELVNKIISKGDIKND
ncbi:hypothetical protein A4S06_08460 [Erysipelotrichaceae bacterium MTC7]|nr:hypothetical protein A4S06_08460 [Erysipelotrichaceae bacterium MTC7]